MKDEIKEILDNPKILMLNYGNYILLDDYVKLKDYIINLQDTLQDREEYIGHLEELCDKYEEEHNTTFEYWKQLVKEDYKSRCEKAIQREMELSYLCDTQPDEELLKILQGSDKE